MFTLAEAQDAIKNKPEFRCNEREFGFNIDYSVTMQDTFIGSNSRETLILQNLRGTCFDKNGNIISLGFHKFHNLNECPGYLSSDIDFSKPNVIMEKLDGSMVRPLIVNNSLRLITRAGITDVAKLAEQYLETLSNEERDKFEEMCRDIIDCGCTPLFEFCSRAQRIVLDYPEPKLILTAIRNNETGEYFTYTELQQYSARYGCELVQVIDPSKFTSIDQLAAEVRQFHGREGVVVSFDSGFKVKIKADEYVLQHRALDGLRFEKDVVLMILTNVLDDVLPLLNKDKRTQLEAYRSSVLHNIQSAEQTLQTKFSELNSKFTTRSEFASAAVTEKEKIRPYLFRLYSGKSIGLVEDIIKHCSSGTRLETMRFAIGPSMHSF